uniref:DNA ligase (NAD(+)) n=1 Tax=viral metagenome TaxID=1070528 RepID=A0A6C0BUJ7_9ZZZZ
MSAFIKKSAITCECPEIVEFKTKGISYLDSLGETQLSNMILVANDHYYNGKNVLLSDNQYDIVKEYIELKFPKNQVLKKIGAPASGKNKVLLPYEMPSMDKIKPDSNALVNWCSKYNGPYLLSCKLDGVSGLYSTVGDVPKLYTRGDGKVGQDISHLLPVFNLPKEPNIVVRGEFIIPKKVFDEKYKAEFANPRNLVSGIINSKHVDAKAKDLHFVTYEVVSPPMEPKQQLIVLKVLKHKVVCNKLLTGLSNITLSELLQDWRKTYEYEIDGVIVTDNKIYPRKTGNPDYAFAFKMVLTEQIAEAKVVDVIWSASKDGYLKPRVRIEPVKLGGVTIEYATGFNGKFIQENGIGIGAVIEIIRSGDVIPYIKSVTMAADKAKMPEVAYTWTSTGVDIILENMEDDITVREKNITAFFVSLKVEGLSSGNVKRIMNAGFDTVPKILKMKKTDFAAVEGFKDKMIEKVFTGIQEKVTNSSLLEIMVASNLLGRGLGERKIRPILDKYPNILTTGESGAEKMNMLQSVDGIGIENAKSFVSNIPGFIEFLKACDLLGKLNAPAVAVVPAKPSTITSPLSGKKIVMTKIRDKDIIEYLKTAGGSLEDNIKKDTFALVVKSHDDVSNKTKFAQENNIPIMTAQEFKDKYMH